MMLSASSFTLFYRCFYFKELSSVDVPLIMLTHYVGYSCDGCSGDLSVKVQTILILIEIVIKIENGWSNTNAI